MASRSWAERNYPALALWVFILGAALLVKRLQQGAAGG